MMLQNLFFIFIVLIFLYSFELLRKFFIKDKFGLSSYDLTQGSPF